MANQLIYETSPYLLQHAHNPVNWFPWGPEALEKALRENKPIFLSIGYAACHWCHVMEHETFEDPAIAELLNRHFVSIKVDREERPDLDSIYMNAVVTMTGQGGWPMSVFLTPQMEPFYGGTYFPPTRRYGMPAFKEVLHAIIQSWKNDSAEIIRVGRDLARHLQESNAWGQGTSNMSRTTVLQQATQALLATYDWENGGWGHAPRFPQPMAIEYLLIQATRGVEKALDAASHALKQMSRGGMYDVVGGGFHRYSTDNTWLVPHFEKMLYDNAQLALVYLHAYLLTGDTSFRNVCTETLDFLTREMRHPSGGFFSSLDADSEGEEGKYYLWTFEQIITALPNEEDRKLVIQAFSISTEGNFDGKNILQRQATLEDTAEKLGMSPSDLSSWLSEVLAKLLSARNLRARPLTDEKVLVSWNALALRVFAEAARYLRREDYLETARENARFLLKQMYHDGRLLRAWRDGTARHNAYLEDYAGLIIGLLELYQSDPDVQWYQTANDLAEDMLQNFQDPQGGFFDTRNDHGSLLVRPKDFQDNATPSGNALAAAALLRLASYSEKVNWREITESMFQAVQKFLVQHPVAFACWLQGLDFYSGPVQQVALVGPISHPHSVEMTNLIWRSFRPRLVFAAADELNDSRLPGLITGRKMLQGLPTAYVCEGFTCRLPVNDIGQFNEQLT